MPVPDDSRSPSIRCNCSRSTESASASWPCRVKRRPTASAPAPSPPQPARPGPPASARSPELDRRRRLILRTSDPIGNSDATRPNASAATSSACRHSHDRRARPPLEHPAHLVDQVVDGQGPPTLSRSGRTPRISPASNAASTGHDHRDCMCTGREATRCATGNCTRSS